jgi:hypothetical protein
MSIPIDVLDHILAQATDDFFISEVEAILDTVSERNNCQRFSVYLERRAHEAGLTDYHADTEWNRKQGGQVKTILDENLEVVRIQSDLILHSRGSFVSEDNLIAIEMKKAGMPEPEKAADRKRLRAMTKSSFDGVWSNDGTTHPQHVCGYRIGLYIELDAHRRMAKLERYSNGECVRVDSIAF